jgi:hypothetical protein
MRIFKSDMDEMKAGGTITFSAGNSKAAEDETVHKTRQQAGEPTKL